MTEATRALPGADVRARLDDLIGAAGPIDWSRPQAAYPATTAVFDRILAEEGLLGSAVAALAEDRTGCESYPCMDKLLLWRSGDGALRLRLHVFSPGYLDRPHNHRWNFACRVLSGTYLHSVYGDESEVLEGARRGEAPHARHVHPVAAGSDYFLEHSLVHSLSAQVTVVSLVLRGPSVKDDYFTWEGTERQVVWSSGAALETAAEQHAKAMDEQG